MYQKAMQFLKDGKWLRHCEFSNKEIMFLKKYSFFTTKPVVYLANISTKNFLTKKNSWLPKIKEWTVKNCPG